MQMDEPRMCFDVEKSLMYLKDQPEIMLVVNAWIQWIKNYSDYRVTDDYGMSVFRHLLKFIKLLQFYI